MFRGEGRSILRLRTPQSVAPSGWEGGTVAADAPGTATGPEAMRGAMADYIHAVHQAYLEAISGRISTEQLGKLPLLAGPFDVAAVGASQLHVIATRDLTLPLDEREITVPGGLGPLSWTVRFLDPVIVPPLGLIDDVGPTGGQQVVATLGVSSVLYHLTSTIAGALSPHQATHAGAGLANAHLRALEGTSRA